MISRKERISGFSRKSYLSSGKSLAISRTFRLMDMKWPRTTSGVGRSVFWANAEEARTARKSSAASTDLRFMESSGGETCEPQECYAQVYLSDRPSSAIQVRLADPSKKAALLYRNGYWVQGDSGVRWIRIPCGTTFSRQQSRRASC